MVSKASDDLPEPESPVITTSRSRGMSRSTFFRLCSRAPRIEITRTSGSLAALFFLRSAMGFCRCRNCARLLHPELVHGDEGVGIFLLELVPVVEIGSRRVVGEPLRVALERSLVEREAEKHEPMLGEEVLDLRQREAVLLHVKK